MERYKHNPFPIDSKSHYSNYSNYSNYPRSIKPLKNSINQKYNNNTNSTNNTTSTNNTNINNNINKINNNNIINNMNNNNNKETTNNAISSLWDNFITIFKPPSNNVTPNRSRKNESPKPRDNTPEQYCCCKKTHSRDYCDSIYEIIQMTKNSSSFDAKRSKDLYKSLLKINDKILDINGDNITQIKKDLNRTYPSISMFKKEKILIKLKNILRAFSNYDNKIKYIQGMNFIVGFFLYHCEEYVAFWLFVSLIEEYNLREIFMEGFPGLKKHVKIIENILRKDHKNIWNLFEKIGVKVEIFMVEWLFSMFSSLIPLEIQIDFYKGFFSEGWIFFYKMCISAITNLKGVFYEADEIYIALKCGKNEDNVKEEDIKNKWKQIIQKAYTLKLNIGNNNEKA